MREKKDKKITEGEGFSLSRQAPLGMSLGALLGAENTVKHEASEAGAAAEKTPSKPASEKAAGGAKISKVALRRERAGRGGKTVTIVSLPQDYRGDLAALAKELRKALGCGSAGGGKDRPPGRHYGACRGLVHKKRRDESDEERIKRVVYV